MVLGLLCFVRCCAVQCSVLGVRCLLLLLCGLVIHLMAWLIAACALQIGVPSRITSLKTRNPDITVGPKVLVPAIAPKKAVLASLVIEFKPYADSISEGEYDWLQKGWDAALQYDSDNTDGTKQMACLDYAAEYMKAALVKHWCAHPACLLHVCCMFTACLHVCCMRNSLHVVGFRILCGVPAAQPVDSVDRHDGGAPFRARSEASVPCRQYGR